MKNLVSKPKQKLVYVLWQDAFANTGWFSHDELEDKINEAMFMCEDVGWIVYEDKAEIHLVSRRCVAKSAGCSEYGLYQRIPKTWILKKKILK